MANFRVKLPERSVNERVNDFDEIMTGYSLNEALAEADRCLQCKNPLCKTGCPAGNNIPEFIGFLKEGKLNEAYQVLVGTHCLPSICGRVCLQEKQCEKKCVRGVNGDSIAIGALERFVSDNVECKDINKKDANGLKVAVVGSGPASISCAFELIRMGYSVTMFEADDKLGGVLRYGIPKFRLPDKVIDREFEILINAGLVVKNNVLINDIHELFPLEYDAVFLGIGAGEPKFMEIDGENLDGVIISNEFLNSISRGNKEILNKLGNKVVIVGGGNVAIDVARSCVRLGSKKVMIVYRRSFDEMPATKFEIEEAKKEGVQFNVLTNPKRIVGEDRAFGVECVSMELGEVDSSGRRKPTEILNSEHIIECDSVVMAIGSGPNRIFEDSFATDDNGWLVVDSDTFETSEKGVFAGGDIVTGSKTVISAIVTGKKASIGIDKFLSGRLLK